MVVMVYPTKQFVFRVTIPDESALNSLGTMPTLEDDAATKLIQTQDIQDSNSITEYDTISFTDELMVGDHHLFYDNTLLSANKIMILIVKK